MAWTSKIWNWSRHHDHVVVPTSDNQLLFWWHSVAQTEWWSRIYWYILANLACAHYDLVTNYRCNCLGQGNSVLCERKRSTIFAQQTSALVLILFNQVEQPPPKNCPFKWVIVPISYIICWVPRGILKYRICLCTTAMLKCRPTVDKHHQNKMAIDRGRHDSKWKLCLCAVSNGNADY